ncbi:MAG: hypothetical protein P4N24_09940 [Acidobacteriota bacterium]|nr:hypothetical protein [Acidobacteriota bacterium]
MKFRSLTLTTLLALTMMLPSCAPPSWVAEAESIAKVALPIVQGITSIAGASPAVSQAVNDINLLITLFDKYQAAPAAGTLQQIQAGLNTANADIAQIMPAAGIKNTTTQSKVAAVLQLVTSEFSNIASLVPQASGLGVRDSGLGPKPETRIPNPALKLPFTAKEFKAQYNRIVTARTGDAECDQAFSGKELK